MSEWQPIETAPKDGTTIDLWLQAGERIADARWNRDAWRFWCQDEFESMDWIKIVGRATHWMPLPEPPK